jgi:carbonic anhydrase
MDARIDPLALLGLSLGEAHVLRNAGGVVTDDVVRSLALSQHLLGTRHVTLVHHTRCGIERLDAARVGAELAERGGVPVPFDLPSFDDPADSVRATAARLRRDPFLRVEGIEGYVYDVDSGELVPVPLEVSPPSVD